MNRKLIFVGLLLGLFIFPLFLNIHKVNADDKAPVMNELPGCPSGTALAECQNGTAEERIECYKKNDKAYGDRIECYTNNDKAYRERILELERNLLDNEPPGTDGDACQEQQQGITQLSDLLLQCREDHAAAKEEIGHSQRKIEDTQIVVTEHAQTISDLSNQLAESKTRAAPLEEQIRSLTSTLQEQVPQNVQLTAEVQRLTVNLESCNATRLAREGMLTQQVSECKQDQAQHAQSAQHPVADEPVPDAGPRQQAAPEVSGPARHVHANGRVHEDWTPDRNNFNKIYQDRAITCEYFLELISLGGLRNHFCRCMIVTPSGAICTDSTQGRADARNQACDKGVRATWFWNIGGLETYIADGMVLLPRDPSGTCTKGTNGYDPPNDTECLYHDPDREPVFCQP